MCITKQKLEDSKIIKECKMEKIEMTDILNTIAIISLSMIGVLIVLVATYVVSNIVIERKQLKLFSSKNKENTDSK